MDEIFSNANKNDFMNQLNKAVLCKYHTSQFVQKYDINTYCGLGCYIPLSYRDDLNIYYKTLKWYKDAGLDYLYKNLKQGYKSDTSNF